VLRRQGAPKILQRVVPLSAVAKFRDKIERIAGKIIEVHKEERMEKEIRQVWTTDHSS
jgi:hypothetical protein